MPAVAQAIKFTLTQAFRAIFVQIGLSMSRSIGLLKRSIAGKRLTLHLPSLRWQWLGCVITIAMSTLFKQNLDGCNVKDVAGHLHLGLTAAVMPEKNVAQAMSVTQLVSRVVSESSSPLCYLFRQKIKARKFRVDVYVIEEFACHLQAEDQGTQVQGGWFCH